MCNNWASRQSKKEDFILCFPIATHVSMWQLSKISFDWRKEDDDDVKKNEEKKICRQIKIKIDDKMFYIEFTGFLLHFYVWLYVNFILFL